MFEETRHSSGSITARGQNYHLQPQSLLMLSSNFNHHQQSEMEQQQQQQQRPRSSTAYFTINNEHSNPNQQQQRRKHPNYFSFIKRSSLNKGSFEINGRHNECISCKDNVFYVKNLKFPDCVVRNLCQIYKYQGELWFRNHSTDENNDDDNDGHNDLNNDDNDNDETIKCSKSHHQHHQQQENNFYETIYEKIHVELNDFYSFIKPLKEDEILRKATFFCLSDSIKKLPFVKQV